MTFSSLRQSINISQFKETKVHCDLCFQPMFGYLQNRNALMRRNVREKTLNSWQPGNRKKRQWSKVKYTLQVMLTETYLQPQHTELLNTLVDESTDDPVTFSTREDLGGHYTYKCRLVL